MFDGIPLPTIKDRCIKLLSLAEELKLEIHGAVVKIRLQCILNLMGLDDETTELNGSVLRLEELDETANPGIHLIQLLLLVYFGAYEIF